MDFTDKFYIIATHAHSATLWVLILLSILSIAFILERFLALRKVRAQSKAIGAKLQDMLQANEIKEITELAKDRDSLEGRALSYGLRHINEKGHEGVEEIFNSFALQERPKLEKYLNFLATVGSNAPFIGLLGTVFGIMDAFRELANNQGEAQLVMTGISQALVATAIGLLVAIPAVVAYNYFQKQVKATFQSLESVRDLCLAYAKGKKG
jgi:biopolymer transport protein TolQ